MKLTNKLYIICMIFIVFIALNSFYSFNIQKTNVQFEERQITSENFAKSKEYAPNDYEFVSDCDTLESAIDTIGFTPIKEYSYDDNTYIFVSKGLELFETRVVLYKYSSIDKKLYLNTREYRSIAEFTPFYENQWYDEQFVLDIMNSHDKSGRYIIGGDKYNDVYYGAWFGDEIKNMSFEEGKFEYSLLGTEDGENVYFWTYELNNSYELLEKLLTPIEDDPYGSMNYKVNDIKSF